MAKPLVISVSEPRAGGASHIFVFDRFPVIFGRDHGANLIIDRDAVSALHGVFDMDPTGTMTYSDLGSRDGTFLNGAFVAVDDPVAVRHGDLLSVGDLRMRILSQAPEEVGEAPRRNPFAEWDGPLQQDRSPRLPPLPLTEDSAPIVPATTLASPGTEIEAHRPATVTAPPDEHDGLARAFPRPMDEQGSHAGRRSLGRGFFQPGERLANGRYEILSFIGAGGMSAVYRARDFHLKDTVAIKVLSPELAARADALERFEREGRSARKIRSPNVVEIYDFGSEDGIPYIVMELLPGEPLSALISRGPLPVSRALRIILDVCNGVIAAHDEGIVHRDLKPDNIFLVKKGSGDPLAKVLDFGISKTADSRLTQLGTIVGTRHYQSPEQATGSPHLEARSDEFALAVILYECLTQRTPHEGTNAMIVTRNLLEGRFKRPREIRPDIPEELERAMLRAMELAPADRFPSVRDLGEALRPFAPPDAQALFMRLSSDRHHRSGAIVEVAPSASARRANGAKLLPGNRPAARAAGIKTQDAPPGGQRSMGTSGPAPAGRASRDPAAAPPVARSHRAAWIASIAAASIAGGAALVGSVLLHERSNHTSNTTPAARPVTVPVSRSEPPAAAVILPPTANPAPARWPVGQSEKTETPSEQTLKKHVHHTKTEAGVPTPHKVGDVWVIPSEPGTP